MKKILAVILCLTFVFAAFGSIAVLAEETAAPVEGFTQDDEKKEFRASTADGLMELARVYNAGGAAYAEYNIYIDADIDMAGKTWTPIANAQAKNYRGTFDGQGHTITGLSVQDYSNALGLIAYAGSGVVVKDVHLVGVSFHSTKAYNGTIIGRLENIVEVPVDSYALITGCTVQGTLATDANYAGGLVGAIHNGKAITVMGKDAEGNDVEEQKYIPANLVVENCAVNMNLSAVTNYACGIIGGDSFQNDKDSLNGAIPSITCKNVFVTGTYKSPSQASGFIGYCNIAKITLENCFSAAKVEGDPTVSGSFLTRTRKGIITVRECYSISDMPFTGEIENLATLTDADGKVLDMVTIVNSYSMLSADGAAPVLCGKLTTLAVPTAPVEGATAEEITAYNEAVKAYNDLVIVSINNKTYGIDAVADTDENGVRTVKLAVPAISETQMVKLAGNAASKLFAAGSKQKELVEKFLVTLNCPHEELRELATSMYISTNATCTAQATYHKSCTICGKSMDETFAAGELAPHTWAERWGNDETNHFHACTVCREATTDVGAHVFGDWKVTKEATTSKEGKKVRECETCGHELEEVIPKLPAPTTNTPTTNTPEEEEGGCGSAIGGASIIIMLAAAGAVVLRKKED